MKNNLPRLYIALALLIIPFILNAVSYSKLIEVPNDFIKINNIIATIGFIIGLHYLLTHTDFRKTIYQRIFFICYSILFVGYLAKLQHWSWASLCLTLGFLILMITYIIRFVLKKNKLFPDWLKIIWFELYMIARFSSIQHFEFTEVISDLAVVVFIILLFYFIYHEKQLKKLQQDVEEINQVGEPLTHTTD